MTENCVKVWDCSDQQFPHYKSLPQPKESIQPNRDTDIVSRLKSLKSELPAIVGRIVAKELDRALKHYATTENLEEIIRGLGRGLNNRLAGFAEKKSLDEIRDLISAVSESGGPDLDAMLILTTRIRKEIEAKHHAEFLEFKEEVKWAVAELAKNNEDKIFEWGERLEAKIDGLKMALENIKVSVQAEIPAPQVSVNVPQQPAPTVNVSPQITMPRRKIKREIEYDAQSGRPKSLLDVEEFLEEQETTSDGEKGGVRQTRGSVGGAGTTYGNLFKKPKT